MRICFVAPNVYPMLAQIDAQGNTGGAELQQVEIAKDLVSRGFDVSFVVRDHGQPQGETLDGIKIFKTFKQKAGIRGLRFFYPRLTRLWLALKLADAQIYYTRTASFIPGVLRLFCHLHQRKYVFAGALNSDFIPEQVCIPTQRDKWLYWFGLKRAAAIITQSDEQQSLLKRNVGLAGTVIRNFLPSTSVSDIGKGGCVLWVATIRERKCPMKFVQLARALPQYRFVMIGGPLAGQEALYQRVEAEAAELPNMDFLGFRPFHETEKYFERSKLFVNTSASEGFPNTFLQAWRRGVPVVSTLDPDNAISSHALGAVVADDGQLASTVARFMEQSPCDPGQIKAYFDLEHGSGVMNTFAQLMHSLV